MGSTRLFLRLYYFRSGAINLVHKVQLLEAEYASLSSKDIEPGSLQLLPKYDKAIVAASRTGFLQDGALGNYLCGMYCLRQQDGVDSAISRAQQYVEKAHELYTTWGATAVAESLESRHPILFADGGGSSRSFVFKQNNSGFRSRTHFRESLALMHRSLSKAKLVSDHRNTTRSLRPNANGR